MAEPILETVPVRPDPPPKPGYPPGMWLLAGLAGLVVGALAIGGAWLATGTTARPDTRPIPALTQVGQFEPYDRVLAGQNPRITRVIENERKAAQENTKRLSESHGGAAALYAHLADDGISSQLMVQIYRDQTANPPFVPFGDSTQQTIQQHGDVSCVLIGDLTRAARCTRSSETLTVEITPAGVVAQNPAEVSGLVDEIWEKVS
ncbi:hypothetical protein [Actinocrispum sp. NPDC049592]|uniref:hypothetical protein n=1 Tax=Actinocrispum sp. NPDC049592 TaxID=3154835 RepID=UPI00341E38C7